MIKSLNEIKKALFESVKDLLPIVLVVGFFQIVVLRQPISDYQGIFIGSVFVIIGLTLFVKGLDITLFPIGETMAYAFARKGNLFWLLIFGFCLGFGTTIAEPALIAVVGEVSKIAAESGVIENTTAAKNSYASGLRVTVALSVGAAVVVGIISFTNMVLNGLCAN